MPFTKANELEAAKIGRQFKDRFASRNQGNLIGNDARIRCCRHSTREEISILTIGLQSDAQ